MKVKFLQHNLDPVDIINDIEPSKIFKLTEYLSIEFSKLNSVKDMSRSLIRLLDISMQECYDYLISLEITKDDPDSDVIDFLEKKFDSDFKYIDGSIERRWIAEYKVKYDGVLFHILTNEDYTNAIILSVESSKLSKLIDILK